jgi:hypothetical protein
MMNCRSVLLVAALIIPALSAEARADFLIYYLGGGGQESGGGAYGGGPSRSREPSGLKIVLQGDVKVIGGGIVSYRHPSLKQDVHFGANMLKSGQIEYMKARTTKQEFQRILGAAGKDPDAMLKAGVWALKKGLLKDFYTTVDRVLDIDPKHEHALRIKELKAIIDKPLEENPATEKELRSLVRQSGMRIEPSKHFLLLHDTELKPEPGQKKNRAQQRLALLEQVYESFLLLFHSQIDIPLEIPSERMKVVLFKNYDDFHQYAIDLSPALASASGFWEQIRNVSYFFDHGTTETFKMLEKVQKELHKVQQDARKARDPDTINMVKVIDLLIAQERENADITVVSHEATHQMAGNTGLLPRHVVIPSWVHEGLATYFEAPGDATWAGIGAVNEQRLSFYRALEKDTVHSNIDFIVSDQIFDYAGGIKSNLLHGYGQAWALTHFMLENHIKEFVGFYRMLGEMPPDVRLNPDLLQQLFSRVFGSDHKSLNQEWRSYMRTLKTDLERQEESAEKKGKK